MVGRLGFEPGMTEPKPVVLPLHHRPIAAAKVRNYFEVPKFCSQILLHDQQVVVLLALLGEQILAVDEILSRDDTVLISELLLVQTDATALYHLAHLTL